MICTTYFLTFFSELIPPTGYHQHYYDKKEDTPYCHIYKKIF